MNKILLPALFISYLLSATSLQAADTTAPALAQAPAATEPAAPAATEPKIVSPALMRQDAALGVMQGHMNALLAQRDAINVQVEKLQKQIDAATAMREKLAK